MRRPGAIGLILALLSAGPVLAQPQHDNATTVSAPVAREVGLQAIQAGNPALAMEIAHALQAHDPDDPFAHYLLATALMRMQRLPEAQAAGKLAYRHAQTKEQHYQSARLTALAAYGQNRFTTAQWWLRRAAHHAPEAARRARSVAEFNSVRHKNPLSLALRFAVVPSDNVNSGSSGAFNIIDGVPYVGTLSPDAQALPGTVLDGGIDLGYRLAQSATRETSLAASLSFRAVALSREARAQLVGLPSPDLDQQRLEVTLQQRFFPQDQHQRLSFGITLGQQWQGSVAARPYLRSSIGYLWLAGPATLIDLGASAEQRRAVAGLARGDRVFSLRAGASRNFGPAGSVSGGVFASTYDTELAGRSSATMGGNLSYAPGRDFGPLRATVNVGVQVSRFPGYSIATLQVPGGREDTTGFAELELVFPGADYAGFAPQLNLRHQATDSNVSRFDTRETSVTLGIRSTF